MKDFLGYVLIIVVGVAFALVLMNRNEEVGKSMAKTTCNNPVVNC